MTIVFDICTFKRRIYSCSCKAHDVYGGMPSCFNERLVAHDVCHAVVLKFYIPPRLRGYEVEENSIGLCWSNA